MALDFTLTPEQLAMKESARKFAEREISPGAQERDEKAEFNLPAFRKLGEFGLLGLPVPSEYGGGGADVITMMAAMEGLGKGCTDGGFILSVGAHVCICTIPIWQFGTEDQKKKYLPSLCSGRFIGAFGLTEPNAGSDAMNVATTAKKDGDHYVLNGTKMFITNGSIADVVLVIATVDRAKKAGGLTAFLVDKNTPGFSCSRELHKMGMRSSPTAELVFEDCRVPEANMIGGLGGGARIMVGTLGWERGTMIASAVGAGERVLEKTVKYAQERVQFGKPIAKFQAIQHMLAEMKVNLEIIRLLVYKSAWLKQQGIDDLPFSAITKLTVSELGRANLMKALQIHGGYGYMQEYDIERWLRDSFLGTIGAGTSEIQKMIIARGLMGE
jgi:alkylation response protein AidB-like acyl-CoA dehydrogenase